MKSEKEKQFDKALYQYANKEVQLPDAQRDLPHTFSERYYVKRRKMTRRQRPHPAAAVVAVALILICGISVSAFWEELYSFTMDAKDKFFSLFSEGAVKDESLSDSLIITEVPDRFYLIAVDDIPGMTFYAYTSDTGDQLNIFEENGSQEIDMDAEAEIEIVQISGREVYLSHKVEENTYSIYFRYDNSITISVAGNITRDEAIQIVSSTLNK